MGTDDHGKLPSPYFKASCFIPVSKWEGRSHGRVSEPASRSHKQADLVLLFGVLARLTLEFGCWLWPDLCQVNETSDTSKTCSDTKAHLCAEAWQTILDSKTRTHHVRTYTHVRTHTSACTHTRTHTQIHTNTHTQICTSTHARARTYAHTRTRTHTGTCVSMYLMHIYD